jgi:hypothetical protein
MSYKTFDNIKTHLEIEFIKSLSYEQINDIMNQLKTKIDSLQKELSKLSQHDVSRQSEQLVCDMCGSSKLEECTKGEYSCEDCGHFPITN